MTVLGGPVVYPCRPGFQPGLVAPVAIRISAAFQAFDVIYKLFLTIVTKPIGDPIITCYAATLAATCAGERHTAFFTGCRATGPLYQNIGGPLFTFAEDRLFFQFGAVTLVAYGNDFGHGTPVGLTPI